MSTFGQLALDIDSRRDLPFNASVRRGWKTCVLVIVMLAIYWILVLPQVDLDPATPLNLEALFFAVVAISVLLGCLALGRSEGRELAARCTPLSQSPPRPPTLRLAPLRV